MNLGHRLWYCLSLLAAQTGFKSYFLSQHKSSHIGVVVGSFAMMQQEHKLLSFAKAILKVLLAIGCLYFFICSLDLLATSFRLMGGKNTGKVFSRSDLMKNPIVGLMLGILFTVLVQSSSTTTSVIVGLVASETLDVPQAIPMVMGANIGTSVTNTIVSLTQLGDRLEFERAFACAVLHDIFNWLAVIVLLILEIVTGFLFHLTEAIVEGIQFQQGTDPPDVLKTITKPFTSRIVQIDKDILHGWSSNQTTYENITSLLKHCKNKDADLPHPLVPGQIDTTDSESSECTAYLFESIGISDVWVGLILLGVSLFMLCVCLVVLVKILNSFMKDRMALIIQRSVNADVPYVPWLTGYLALLIGAAITFLVQSSSVFTSTLTPLVGTGFFSLERAYPLTLGSNIGTTTTGILAALAADGSQLRNSLQIAFCHLFFNIAGILLFYPVPVMRLPIPLSRIMGRTVAEYRWFAFLYLIVMFFLFPLYIFGLSLLGPIAIYIGFIPCFIAVMLIIFINVLQAKKPGLLPAKLRNWDFLPEWMRSLAPYDRLLSKCIICKRFRRQESDQEENQTEKQNGNNINLKTIS